MLDFKSNNFAIQVNETRLCKSDKGLLWSAPVRLVIDGHYLGTLESETYIPSFIYAIGEKILSPSSIYFNHRINMRNYRQFFADLDKAGSSRYANMLEETFDDFFLRTVRNEKDVFCAWELIDTPFFSYDSSLENKQYFSIIALDDLRQAVNRFTEWSDNLKR